MIKGTKILYVTPGCYDKGGISRYNRYQIQALMDLVGKENVKVLSLHGPGNDDFDGSFDVTWHGRGSDMVSKLRLIFHCIRFCMTWRPVIMFIGHVNFSGVLHSIAKMWGVRTVLNIYGLEVWSGMSRDAEYGLRNVDYVISDCHSTANHVEDKELRPDKSIHVIWDCVDLKNFRHRRDQLDEVQKTFNLPSRDDHFILLTLGRLSDDATYKGYERLLDVFIRLHKKYPHVRLVYAGKGNLVPVLQEKARNAGVYEDVFFTGSVPEHLMAGVYSYAHVFSLVSHKDLDCGEGIPLTPLEAMACNVPILVGNNDGSQEAVVEGKNGRVVNPFDLDAHFIFFRQLIENDQMRDEMSNAARTTAEKYFSFEDFRKKHAVLLEVMASKQ